MRLSASGFWTALGECDCGGFRRFGLRSREELWFRVWLRVLGFAGRHVEVFL